MDFGRIEFGRRANKRFNYKPRYYDEDKEELNIRIEKAKMEMNGEYNPSGFENRIRHGFRNRTEDHSTPHNNIHSGGKVRFLFILISLGLVFYLTFYTRVFDVIFEALNQ